MASIVRSNSLRSSSPPLALRRDRPLPPPHLPPVPEFSDGYPPHQRHSQQPVNGNNIPYTGHPGYRPMPGPPPPRVPMGPGSNLSGGSDNYPPPLQRPSPSYSGGPPLPPPPHVSHAYRVPHPGMGPRPPPPPPQHMIRQVNPYPPPPRRGSSSKARTRRQPPTPLNGARRRT